MTETNNSGATEAPILYETHDGVATVTLNRPRYANAQNNPMLYQLDSALQRASNDDSIGAIVLAAAGKHFSSGHDLGSPERFEGRKNTDRKTLFYDAEGKPGAEHLYIREQEIYLGLCRRWQSLPKPVVAAVQGACIGGGLMLAWVSDIIVASEDAFFSDPLVAMGVPGAEYSAHAFEMHPRIAREFLMLGDRMSAQRAYEVGMVNRVVSRDQLAQAAHDIAARLAKKPRFAMALTKQQFNTIDDLRGKRAAMDVSFAHHQLSHAHNTAVYGDTVIRMDTPSKSDK